MAIKMISPNKIKSFLTGTSPTKAKTVKKSSKVAVDRLERSSATKSTAAVTKVSSVETVPGVSENFPVGALEKLEAKGIGGQTFMLDGGSLRGLKLEVRRVVDGDEPGFEILFKLTQAKIEPLIEKLDKKDATKTDLSFRGLKLGDDGIATYTGTKGTLSTSGTHAPSDTDQKANQWVRKWEDPKGATIEVVHGKAAQAVRGLVRISLRGNDKTCNKQLDGLIKSLGLQPLLSPPTQKSKQVHALMHVLWQVDNKKAQELSKEDIDKLSVETLTATLTEAGYDPARIAGLRYEETFKGHFSVVDPQQAEDLAKAGARYLYSTVTLPEHVLSILQEGQKSSMQRYQDGMIINGMSTNADFSTGGAVGVFTRLVTQDAIYAGNSWTGRTYKIIQNYQQLGRTDWYGWNGDFFGRRWDLDSKVNFGPKLIESIDNGSYKTTNELIFTAGNRPENIDRVVATTEADRKKLIDLLVKEKYQPPKGLTIEEFVVLSPKFMPFGPSPFKVTDPAAFAKEALELAQKGNSGQLRWFLAEGPQGPERAALEKECLTSSDDKIRGFALQAVKTSGRFAMSTVAIDKLIDELKDQPAILTAWVTGAPEALFRSGSKKAAELLESKPSTTSWPGPYGLSDESWVKIFETLADSPKGTKNECFQLALKLRGAALLETGHAGFKAFLRKHPLVEPSNPKTWLGSEIKKVKEGGSNFELAAFVAQSSPKELGDVRKQLIAADNAETLRILKSTLVEEKSLGISGKQLVELLGELPKNSATQSYLLAEVPDALLRLGNAKLLELVLTHHGANSSNLGMYDTARWESLANELIEGRDDLPVGYLAQVLERGSYTLQNSEEFLKKLGQLENLYDVSDPNKFIEAAMGERQSGKPGALKLLWILRGPEANQPYRAAALEALFASSDYDASRILEQSRSREGGKFLPISTTELTKLMEKLTDKSTAASLNVLLTKGGRQLLTEGNAATFKKLQAAVEIGATPDLTGRLGLDYESFREVLDGLSDKKDALSKSKYEWLITGSAENSIKQSNAQFLGHALAKKLELSDTGLTVDKAVETMGQMMKDMYDWGTPTLPEGVKWLLAQHHDEVDEAMLGKIAKEVKGWGLSASKFNCLLDGIPGLTPAWRKKLEKAQGA